MQWRYGIIDNLNVQWKKPLDLPATLTVGRQDIFLGDGWLVGDGTPEDGSFTYFLDSARGTYDLEDQNTTIDAIGIVQYGRPDAWLPTLGPSTTPGRQPGTRISADRLRTKRAPFCGSPTRACRRRTWTATSSTNTTRASTTIRSRSSLTTRTSTRSAAAFPVWWRTTGNTRPRAPISSATETISL